VLNQEIQVCENISLYMNLIDQRIADPMFYYDDEPVERYINFCEGELTLTDGADLHLLDSFKLWAEDIFGWYYYEERSVYEPGVNGLPGGYRQKLIKRRLINKQYLIVGRGAAKSLYSTTIQAYFLTCDKTTTHQIATAPTMRQADEILAPIRTALARNRGPYFKFLTAGALQNTTGNRVNRPKLCSTKKGIQNFMTNSILEVMPMSVDKLQTWRCKVVSIDEWLSGETREDVVNAVEQSASKSGDYLIVATSSEGTVRNGVGDTMKIELMKILRGEYRNPHVSIWYYRLDDVKEVNDPYTWIKANPNLGQTVTYETYQREVERAENNPSSRNDTLAKRFGIPMEGSTFFFTYQQTLCHPRIDFWGLPCAMGADLSQGDDFCAFTFLFPLKDGRFGVKTRCYITSRTLLNLPAGVREKYNEFLDETSLAVLDGTVLSIDDVYDDLERFIERCQYDIRAFGFDPYNAKEFVERWTRDYGPYAVEKVIQGAKTESVPLGELRNLAEERLLVFDQSIMQYCMGNCISIEDSNGNRKLAKKRYEHKIDAVAAMLDAYVAYKLNNENFD
jgi:phage terminase large subunit-like protein